MIAEKDIHIQLVIETSMDINQGIGKHHNHQMEVKNSIEKEKGGRKLSDSICPGMKRGIDIHWEYFSIYSICSGYINHSKELASKKESGNRWRYRRNNRKSRT